MSVRLFLRLSVRHTPVGLLYQLEDSVMIFSPSERPDILVSGNIWIITKIERGHPERRRYMRLACVKIGNFDDFSTINHRISDRVQDRTKVTIDH